MRAKRELRLFLSVAAIVLLLAFIFFSYAQQQDTTKSSVPILTEVEKRFTPKAGEKPKETPSLSEVERRFLPREQESPKEIPALSGVERKFLPRGGPFPLEVAQLPEVGWPEVREFKDFKGGLDLSTAKTKVPPDRAIVSENALWNEQGEMYKRPGFSEHSTPPFIPNFLYRYYKQDGDKFTMGGSDTALYFWHEDSIGLGIDSSGWTFLMETGGYAGRWDGCTFQDMFIGTHEGITPIAWDGSVLINVGEQSYSYDSSWASNCTLYIHVKNVAWDDDQFVGFYAVQDSLSYSDSGMSFGQIIHNTLDVFTIRYNATSGTNLWGADQNVTLLSALQDSVWAAGIIDTFYTMGGHQSEVLVPGVDTIRAEWTAVPAGSLYINISDYPDTTSHDDYCYTTDTTSVMIVGFGDHTSALTDIDRIWLNIIASNNIDQEIGTAVRVVVRLCHPDTLNYFSYIWQVNQGLENFPYSKRYTRFRVPLNTTPRGHVWTDEGLDSLMLYLIATNQAGGGFGFGDQQLEVYDAWINVEYEQYDVACGFMVYDSSLFDVEGLLDNDITVPTYFELIPEGYDGTPGSPSKTTRQIIDIDSGIFSADYWGNLNYLKLADPEISGLAVGDSFQLRHLYFPTSKFVENFDACLWLGWTGTGADQNKNVVLYSAPSDIANWPPGNEIYIESDDGDYITGMTQFYPDQQGHRSEPWAELVVSKEQSLYRIYPTTFLGMLDYNTMFISRGVGCCSNLAMQMIEGKFIAFPDQHGVWLYNGTGVQPISLLIDPIFEDLELEGLEATSAIYNPQDRHYYLSYPGAEIEHEGFLVSYQITPGGITGTYTQELDTDGAQVDTQYKDLNETTGYHDLGCNSLGRYIHVWQNTLADSGNIWLQRFEADHSMVGDSIRVNDNLWDPTNYELTADMSHGGDIIVVWQDNRQEDAGTNDIWGQILDFSSGKVGTNFVVNECYETNTWDCGEPDVDINDDGFFVVVWQEYSDYGCLTPCCTGCAMEILGQRYSVSEGTIGSNFLVNDCRECTDDTIKGQSYPSVAVGDDNSFVVAWESTRGGNTNDVWKQEFTSTGDKVDCDVMIPLVTYTHGGRPEIAINDDGLYVITWIETNVPSGEIDVFASTFNADHSVKTSGFKVNEDAGNTWDDNQQQVAINSQGNYVIVWSDGRNATDDIFAQVYNFDTGASGSNFCINDYPADEVAQFPEIKCFGSFVPDYNCATLAYSIDHHGWSEETFSFSAAAYQHGLTDSVKVIFADPEETKVYNYGTQADDVDDAVILTYQSPYLPFAQNPSWEVVMSYATLEAFLDTGEVYVYWYKDYSELVFVDTISCGSNCREEMQLPPDVAGHNISMKIVTGSEIDDFTLSGYWWEYLINRWRK